MVNNMKKNGYTLIELLSVVAALGIVALITITKVSYAFENINNPTEQKEQMNHLVEQAAVAFARSKNDEYKKDEDTYIYAKEIAASGFLFEKEEYNSLKVKISYDKNTKSFQAEVVE